MLDPLVVEVLLGIIFLLMGIIRASGQFRARALKTEPTQEGAKTRGTTSLKRSKLASVALGLGAVFFILWFLNIFLYSIISPYLLLLDLPLFSSVTQFVGFCISLIGLGIMLGGFQALGKNWTDASDERGAISLSAEHELVQTRIYSRIRHPIYLGSLYIQGGCALLSLEGIMLLIFPIVAAWVYSEALIEEKVLHQHFGEEFERYMRRTGRFLPKRRKALKEY